MEKATRESFEQWAEKHGWLFTGEGANPSGKQRSYLTPEGDTVIAVYDLAGAFLGAMKVPIIPQAQPRPQPVGQDFLHKLAGKG